MVIYGVAILSLCYFAGIFVGDVLGEILKAKANIGGVGFAMLFLILLTEYLRKTGRMSKAADSGIAFWSAMYIPVIIAMAAQQNVIAAVKGGPLAIAAGAVSVIVAFLFIPLLSKITRPTTSDDWKNIDKEA